MFGGGYCLGGMKAGPTERIGLSEAAPVDVAAGGDAWGWGGVAGGVVAVPAVAPPFLVAAAGAAFGGGGRAIFFALSSVTMMSPCCSAVALSSTVFSASDQVWPTALQAQDGLNSVR